MPNVLKRTGILWSYALLTYLVLQVNTSSYLARASFEGVLAPLFIVAVDLTYDFIYLMIPFFPILLLNWAVEWKLWERLFRKNPALKSGIVYGAAFMGFTLLQILIYADRFIFQIYDFHLNSFVWNLVMTRGGIESLQAGGSTVVSIVIIVAGLAVVQAVLLVVLLKMSRVQHAMSLFCSRRAIILLISCFICLTLFERFTFAHSFQNGYEPVLSSSRAFPLYLPLKLGKPRDAGQETSFEIKTGRLCYPLQPLRRSSDHPRYNIVWLVSESWRADMIDPDVMPATCDFAQRAVNFTNHYSGGNGTRMGMFSMFYGLYGSYWFPFLESNREPVLMDMLVEDGYQMEMFTSARFSYPEFDQTIFARIPADRLREDSDNALGWQRDRTNIGRILDFIDHRDPARPFMTFMFFESPHAPYNFPPETAFRKPYMEDMNYATMDLQRDIGLIKNRYLNSCRHLDTQILRVLTYLRDHSLLDSTIVVITGDHGEEFMEKGRWGHNSAFTEEQIRVPLVLWIPGQSPRQVSRMTSHLDIPATILPILGVVNPPGDYSLGSNALGETPHEFIILSDWDHLTYLDDRYKAEFPLNGYEFLSRQVTTRNDEEIKDKAPFFQENKDRLVQIMKDLSRFIQR